jgi:phosphohistidine phosphatase
MDVMTKARRLIVMRHGKAGDLPGGPDLQRALKPRGSRDSAAAGRWLAGRGFIPDLVICSPARRASQTWQYVSEQFATEPRLTSDARLYDAGGAQLLDIVAETAAEVASLMYVGHNPAAADLTALLAAGSVDFPTAAIAVIAVPDWPGLGPGDGTLVASWTPRAGG